MTYSVQIGMGGLAGWRLLQRTSESQKNIISGEAPVRRAQVSFTNRIRPFTSIDDFMSDKSSLKSALKFFGLSRDIEKTDFIKKVISSDTSDPQSYANRLKDSRYAKLATALGFGKDQSTGSPSQDDGQIDSASALVNDYRSLSVALTAFGLENDIPNKAFIRKVLESDLSDPKSLANKLSDKRYKKLAEAFSFSAPDGKFKRLVNSEKLSENFLDRTFELRVGQSNGSYRLALNAKRELSELAKKSSKENTKWFEVLGSTPLRRVMSGALGLNENYLKLPIDRQVEELRSAAERQLGIKSLAQLSDPQLMNKLLDRFIVRDSVANNSASKFNVALTLLSS